MLPQCSTGRDVLAVEARCPADTVAGFLARHRRGTSPWPAGTTVILDEAAMTTTDDLAALVDLVRRNRWRLVAIGDPAQLSAVGRGGVFAHWCNTVPRAELLTPRRFHQAWEAHASLALRAGDPTAAEQYERHGRLRTIHPAMLVVDVARTHQRHATAGRTVAVTTNTAATAKAINCAIQDLRNPRAAGAGAQLADGTTARVGDQIATRRNDPTLRTDEGVRVRNRHTWTVTAVADDGSLAVTHPDRGTVELPPSYVGEHVELGWAVTGYGNQGDTVDVGIAVLEPGTNRNHAYVAMTRGHATNLAVIPDATGTTDPAAALTDIITRTPRHDSALATRTRLHRDAGVPEPPFPRPDVSTIDDELVAQVRSTRRRLDQLQSRTPGPSLGL